MTKDPKADPAGFAPAGGPKLETAGAAPASEEDDPQLKSLRAVWLAMPDEEPPDRGLAELMAAARVKADEMSAPSLWQRIVALLRRPPVLALATVLVLIGGAVFIGQRREQLAPTNPIATEDRMRDNAAQGSAAEVIAQPVAPDPAQEYESGAAGTAAPAEIAAPAAEPAPPRAPSRVNRRPASPRPEGKSSTSRGMTNAQVGKNEGLARDKPADTKARGLDSEDDSEATISSDSFAPPPPAEAPRPDSVTTTGTATPQGEKAPTQTAPTQPARSRASQYLAQAKSAAARGDCTAARTLMKRVASEDTAAYRNALAGDAALKKCVIVAQ